MLRREDEGERAADAEPAGDLARSRKRWRRLQVLVYWAGLLLISGLLALFLAVTLPERGKAEQAERNAAATISAHKTETANATAAAATAAASPPAPTGQ